MSCFGSLRSSNSARPKSIQILSSLQHVRYISNMTWSCFSSYYILSDWNELISSMSTSPLASWRLFTLATSQIRVLYTSKTILKALTGPRRSTFWFILCFRKDAASWLEATSSKNFFTRLGHISCAVDALRTVCFTLWVLAVLACLPFTTAFFGFCLREYLKRLSSTPAGGHELKGKRRSSKREPNHRKGFGFSSQLYLIRNASRSTKSGVAWCLIFVVGPSLNPHFCVALPPRGGCRACDHKQPFGHPFR